MALMALSTSVPMAENDSLVSRQRQEDRDESISQKQACSVDEGVTIRHPFADLGNTASTTTGASLDGSANELTPKKPSTTSKKRPKSTEGELTTATSEVMTTVKKKKTQRKPAPAANSLKDAKSELGANDGELMMIH